MLGSEVTEVYAQANRIIHGGDVAIETGGLVMLTFANGAYASIDCSWSKPANYPTWGGVTMQFVCDGGVVRVDGFNQNLRVTAEADNTHTWSFWGSDINQAMIDEFVDAIREGRPPLVTGEDGLRAVEIVEAAYRSIADGQPVRVG
jgi:predicted dehydrogenase